jgi:hypothetical protein
MAAVAEMPEFSIEATDPQHIDPMSVMWHLLQPP